MVTRMSDPQEILREPPPAGDELSTLLGSLERQRRTFAWKCSGLDSKGLSTKIAASDITLGGLLKHMALVEEHTFSHKLFGRGLGSPWDNVDWEADPDWEWHTAAGDSPEDLTAMWEAAVGRSRALVSEAFSAGGLDHLGPPWPDGRAPSLRRLIIDMVEEYARHVGHADLVRESIDGMTGEDPPE
jgi:hypothetical protein